MNTHAQSFDLVVAGGGTAGFCAAVAAARHGLTVCLVHERPVLGGVASSEMRVTVHGAAAHHAYGRETGIINEALTEERARNHEPINENGWTNSVFDQVLYDLAVREPNLTLHLNTVVTGVEVEGGPVAPAAAHTAAGYYTRPACAKGRITALRARTLSAETEYELRAPLFVDCTGDGMVADAAGCAWRMGSEGRAESGEDHAPEAASTDTMGNSIHIRARDIGRDAPFTPPAWAMHYDNADFFYKQGRPPTDPRGGYWWIEIGVPWHTIFDNEKIRHELTRHALGVWDWMKNRDPVMKERCRTYALEFVGQVPGKRESRRVVGRHWMTENDIQARVRFPDEIAFGGWFIDLHTPGGLLAPTSEPHSAEGYSAESPYFARSYVGPYGIPLRTLMARDVDNLFLAGRCVSVTRAALGSVRVMGTTALMGQAVGTVAALMRERGMDLPAMAADAAAGGPVIRRLQQVLLRDGCWLPNVAGADAADLARSATATASSSALLHGQSPDEPEHANGQGGRWPARLHTLEKVHGQTLYLGGGRLDRLELLLDNPGSAPAEVPVRLVRLDGFFDYRRGVPGQAEVVAEAVLPVPAGRDRWVSWAVDRQGLPDGAYRLEAGPAPGLGWRHVTAFQPGHTAVYQISATRMRARHAGFAFRVAPGQAVYGPGNVLTGVNRPQARTNLWRSDPGQGIPQWLQLEWSEARGIGSVELTFAGHLVNEVHYEPPFFRDPQTVRDYAIEVDDGSGAWREVLRVEGNYERQRRHTLPPGTRARRLRLVALATKGDAGGAIYDNR